MLEKLIKIGSGIQKLLGGGDLHIDTPTAR
jgi:hypothetical protein